MRPKVVIGWTERIDFPDWDIAGIKAKIDTGARTSALHVDDLERLRGRWVRFRVVYTHKPPFRRRWVTAKAVKWARVRSSTGEYSQRCFVATRVKIGDITKTIEISLVSRENMLFRMLLGRKALEKDFLVDVSHRSVDGKRTSKRKATTKK